ncbi:MAG: cytochrome c3 family protein, partial [Planctomycetota bacterium]
MMGGAKPSPKNYQRLGLLLAAVTGFLGIVRGEDVLRNSSRECAICHIRWVEAFERAVGEDGGMDTVLERQAGSGDMCLSCHDGSVTDSRFKVWSTKHHTTGSKPSPDIEIPTERFPLDSEGRMTCATCHTAHAVPDSSDLKTVVFLRQANVDSSLCLACHGEHAQKNEYQHPLGRRDTPVPQVILDAGGQTSEDGHMVFCQTCHEPHGARNAWMLVLPPTELCIACHTDKAPEAAPANGAPMHSIGHTYPGFEPPESLLSEKATFRRNGELDCLSCHRLHDASGAWPLLIQKNEDSSLCLECHKKEAPVIGSPHDLRKSSPDTVNARGEKASESGPCGSCHRIHGWAREVPDTNRPHSSGCMECHNEGGPGSRNRPYVDSHPVGVPLSEGMTTDFPLDSATGNIGCLTCHDPHLPLGSQIASEDTEEATSFKPKKEFVRLRTGGGSETVSEVQEPRSFLRAKGSELCSHCHDKVIDSRTPHDPAGFSPAIRRKLVVHPSIGSCRVCHATHNAHGPRLWARTPLRTDDESVSNLCGTCHENKQGIQGSVHDAGATDWAKELGFVSKDVCVDCHPIHAPPGEDGIWNSIAGGEVRACETCHRVEAPGTAVKTPHLGEKPGRAHESLPVGKDGGIRCSTCHDIHQDAQEAMLLRGSRWDSSLCISCHPGMSGLVGTAHDLRTSAADALNVRDETAVESGPCGSCHLVHCFAEGDGVRAQSSMSEADFSRAMCLGCHSKGGSAEDRIPKHLEHPEIPLMNRTEPNNSDYMPT